MFLFIIRYFGFLKFIPGMGLLFDCLLKLGSFITKPVLLDWIDDIEAEALTWNKVRASTHKYGGLQLNYLNIEIGHIHSNGLLDMLLSREIKGRLIKDGRIHDHHSFKNTGWISFYIHTKDDADYALELLRSGYERLEKKDMIINTN